MEKVMFRKFATKMGITSARVIRQAEEYVRLSQVKSTALGNVTATSKAVLCLDLAATSMKLPLDKEFAIRLSGINEKVYQSNLKAMECLLGLESNPCLRDLGVQYGCLDAVKVAAQTLKRYKNSLPSAQQQALDISKPLFTTAALHAACKSLKIRVDKKLAASSGAKKAIFDRLSVQLQKIIQDICKEGTALKTPQNVAQKRPKMVLGSVDQVKDDCLLSSPKRLKNEDEDLGDNEKMSWNYEEWKRKILENALKSKQTDA